MKIGLSLSRCVKDIIDGKVHINDVTCLITGTCAPNDAAWERLKNSYCATDWYSNPGLARETVDILRATNRVVQPRENMQPPHYLGAGASHWMELSYEHGPRLVAA